MDTSNSFDLGQVLGQVRAGAIAPGPASEYWTPLRPATNVGPDFY
jgi:hypothetical protein